jgi:ADP-heptose:LPS heptosyltransferase
MTPYLTGKNILLGILVSNGDCLMATVVARQIKHDFPDCHLTWAVSSFCSYIIENNPDIDHIWIVEVPNKKEALNAGWYKFKKEAFRRKSAGDFDEVFLLQIYPDNLSHFDGTTRGTIYGSYPYKITVYERNFFNIN